eukprot:gene33873-41785_t
MNVLINNAAALHSFTISLRHQLKDTSIKVIEILPPAVETEMGKDLHGMDLNRPLCTQVHCTSYHHHVQNKTDQY